MWQIVEFIFVAVAILVNGSLALPTDLLPASSLVEGEGQPSGHDIIEETSYLMGPLTPPNAANNGDGSYDRGSLVGLQIPETDSYSSANGEQDSYAHILPYPSSDAGEPIFDIPPAPESPSDLISDYRKYGNSAIQNSRPKRFLLHLFGDHHGHGYGGHDDFDHHYHDYDHHHHHDFHHHHY